MKAHGGTLEATSEGLGRGAKFTARFKIDDSISKKVTLGDILSAATIGEASPSTKGGKHHSGVFWNDGVERKQPDHALA